MMANLTPLFQIPVDRPFLTRYRPKNWYCGIPLTQIPQYQFFLYDFLYDQVMHFPDGCSFPRIASNAKKEVRPASDLSSIFNFFRLLIRSCPVHFQQTGTGLFFCDNVSGTFICALAAACTFFVVNYSQVVHDINRTSFTLFLADTAADTSCIAAILNCFSFIVRRADND